MYYLQDKYKCDSATWWPGHCCSCSNLWWVYIKKQDWETYNWIL